MHKFDKLTLDGMVNTQSMLKARVKVLKIKRDAGFDVKEELVRANRFLQRFSGFVNDWQYWYYDNKGDPSRSRNWKGPPALPGVLDAVEVRIAKNVPKLVLPRANEIELVLDTSIKKGG